MLKGHDLGKKPTETIGRLAKYYIYIGRTPKETEKMIKCFLLECDPGISLVKWDEIIDRAIKFAKKNPPIILGGIEITAPEMRRIDSLKGRQVQRLAFVLLCIAKYRSAASGKPASWVNTPSNEIMKMANINTSIKRQSAMYSQLRDAGMVRFSNQVDNLNVEVLFAEVGETALVIKDFRNLGYQYMMYHGESYFVCEECGITEKYNTAGNGKRRRQKYCQSCAAKIHMKQIVDSVMRRRLASSNS